MRPRATSPRPRRSSTASERTPPKVELLGLRGEIARATGKPLDAVEAYQAALKVEPGNLFIRESLAETFVELQRFDEAEDQIKRVLLPMPGNPNAHFVKALIAVGRKNLVAADEEAGMAVHLMPSDARFQLLAGTLAFQLNRRNDALQYLRDAVTLLPQNAEARRMLALIYIDRHDANRAEEMFRPVFATYPADPDNARIAARIALLRGNSLAAAKAFDKVDASDPKLVDANLMAASLLLAAGDKGRGFARLRAASTASPANADVDAALVMSYLTFKETREAQAAWNILAQKEPAAARTLNLSAAIDLARGDRAAARSAMEKATAADPHYLAPASGLAMLDVRDGKPDDAQAHINQYLAANPGDPYATLLLLQLEKSGRNRKDVILALLRDAQKANPKSVQIVYALVDQYTAVGDQQQALATAEQGLTFAPSDVTLLQFVGDRAFAAKDNERAITIYSQLVDLNAASPDYPMRLGLAKLASGNAEEALTAFRLALGRSRPTSIGRSRW